MHSFHDSQGRKWSLSLSLAQAKKLKDTLGVDLLDGGPSINRLASDPYTVANVLYLLCESQAAAAGVTDEQFGEALAGDAIDDATEALLNALVDFFPKRQRGTLKMMLEKLTQANSQAVTLAEKKLSSEAMDQMIQRGMQQAEAEIDALLAGDMSGNASV